MEEPVHAPAYLNFFWNTRIFITMYFITAKGFGFFDTTALFENLRGVVNYKMFHVLNCHVHLRVALEESSRCIRGAWIYLKKEL